MTGQRELKTAPDACALNGAGHRPAACFQPSKQLIEHENLVKNLGRGRALAPTARQHRPEIFKVHTRHEPTVLARSNDRALDRLFRTDARDRRIQIGDEIRPDDVHRLARHIDGQRGDTVCIDVEIDGLHNWLPKAPPL